MAPLEQHEMTYVSDDAIRTLPIAWDAVHPEVIIVPDDYSTIQAAVNAAPRTGQTIIVRDGTYSDGADIDADDFDDLVIEGECGAHPVIEPGWGNAFTITNNNNVLSEITIRNFDIRDCTYGIEVLHDADDWDAVTTTLNASRLTITDSSVGIQTGTRTGDYHCSGVWGSIDQRLLDQPITRVNISQCVITDGWSDGMNLWRATGTILSNIIVSNGGEGVHTTDLHDAVIRNNIFVYHTDNQFHLQYPGEVEFANNVVIGSYGYPGDGLVVAGVRDWDQPTGPEVDVHNNVFYGNEGAGAKVGQVSIRTQQSPCEEVRAKTRTWVRNNVFYGNASDPDRYALFLNGADQNLLTDWAEYNLFAQNNGRSYDPALITLGPGNIVGNKPQFLAIPDISELWYMKDPGQIRSTAMGFQPQNGSRLVDAGTPDANYDDVSYMASGTSRCDMGVFGGPSAIPTPMHAGASPTPCLPLVVDWDLDRVLLRDPLFLEPDGNPWNAHVGYDNPSGPQSIDIYWTPEKVETQWLGQGTLISNHELGKGPLEVITVAE